MRVALIIPTFNYSSVYPSFLAMSDFPTGFAYIAGALKRAGHEVIGLNPNNCPGYSSAREMLHQKINKMLTEQRPQLIGIGGLCTDYTFIKDAIKIVRALAPEVPIVFGGGIITHDAEFVFNLLKPDYCIIEDAEEVLIQLIESLVAGNSLLESIPNLGYWRDGIARFTAPSFDYPPVETRAFPDYTPFDPEIMIANSSVAARSAYRYTRPYPRIMPFVAARGCPFRCTFCVHHKGPKYRARPMGDIIKEITQLYKTYRFNILMVLDELFAIDKKRLQKFCDCILEGRRNLGWDFDWAFQTHANANLGRHELMMAKEAGCYLFSYGLESSSPRVLASMNKKTRPKQIREAINLAADVGIAFGGCYIFGDIAETPDTLTETMDFFQSHCMDQHVFFQPISPYPGSKLFDYCLQKGIIKDKPSYYETIDTVLYNMTSMPDKAWFDWIGSIIRPLNTMPHVITVDPYEVTLDRSPRDDNGTTPLWLITARCPHCKVTRLFREPLSEENVKSGNAVFLTGCSSCGKRFKIAAKMEGTYSGEFAQRSISPQKLKTVIHKSILTLENPKQSTPVTTRNVTQRDNQSINQENIHMKKRLRILFIQHELFTWQRAKMWGYYWHLGIEEGLKANNVDFTTLTTTWFPKAKEICAGKEFDQVWINDITHVFEPGGCGGYQLKKEDMEWIMGLAPVRLGFLVESLEYTKEEISENPALKLAGSVLEETIKYLTHIIAVDEKDIDTINHKWRIPSMWLVQPMPERYICQSVPLPSKSKPLFCGTAYGERAKWMKMPEVNDLINHKLSSDNLNNLPNLFDNLNGEILDQMLSNQFPVDNYYKRYLESLREIRRKAFGMYLETSLEGCAVVNLPSYAKFYTGRVYEGMAIGRPVITMETKHRPRMKTLFEDNREILLYPEDNPSVLAEHIRHLIDDPEFGRQIAVNARRKLLGHHTMERRVGHFLNWIETGEEPSYEDSGDITCPKNDKREHESSLNLHRERKESKSRSREKTKRPVHAFGYGSKPRVLFISPPYARFMGLENCRFPLTFGNMATILSINRHETAIYDADFDPALIGKHGNYEYTFSNQHKIVEAVEDKNHYVWNEIKQQIEKFNPDIVGISTMTSKFPMAVRIAEITKSVDLGIKTVIGGHHSSIFGAKLLNDKNIDFAVVGEGEITFLELVNRLCEPEPDFSNIDGLIYKSNGHIATTKPRELVKNLDILPMADRDLMLNENYASENNLIISRGCPFNCNYCGAKVIWKHKVRRRSVQKVIKEIKYLLERSSSRYISFWDDSFTHSKKYTLELLSELKKINDLRFSCITRLDLVERESLIQLKEAGCVNLLFGIESGNDEILKLINKKTTCDSIRRKVEVVNSVGIPWIGFFIMGYPEETKENMMETLRFMRELSPNYAEINIFNPLPGTKTWDELEKKNLVESDMDFSKHSQASAENFFVKDMTKEEFKDLALFMAKEFDKHNRGHDGRQKEAV